MSESDFEVTENEVVVVHLNDGHTFHFPILSNGTVSLDGANIEPNLQAKLEARRFLAEAHNVARSAFKRSGL